MEVPVPVRIPAADVRALLDADDTPGMRQVLWSGYALPGISSNNGDADAALSVAASVVTQVWDTTLTAHRTVSLSTAGAVNGAEFLIMRGAAATGSFNLNIGVGPLKALSASSTWARIQFNGTAWRLIASGNL